VIGQAFAVDYAPRLEDCFFFNAVEDAYDLTGISGRVPEWIRGSWYVNGPSQFERGGMRCNHWLDGAGMICALRFTNEGPHFTSRRVRTRKLEDEDAAGRFLYRGFGTSFPGDRLWRNMMLEPPVNVSVYPFAGRLLAFGEQTLAYELDPLTLQTRGVYDFNGKLNALSPFAAHAKLNRGLLNFGVSFSTKQPMLNVYEFDEKGSLNRRKRYPLAHPYSMHDFGFTPSRVVFFLSPLLMRFEKFWNEGASVMEALSWEPEIPSVIFIAPRIGAASEPLSVEVGEGYCLHFINCFESESHLTVDVLVLEAPVYSEYQPLPDLFQNVTRCQPVRYLIDLESRQLISATRLDYSLAPDFPSIDPPHAGSLYGDFWMLGISACGRPGRKFFDQFVRASWSTRSFDIYQAAPGEYFSAEPCIICNPADRSEAVAVVERLKPASNLVEMLLFDAFAIGHGPIATMPLRHPIHPGFHTSFAPSSRTTVVNSRNIPTIPYD
jgi:all-trans-8'-apo-beta-carotenal 15,15'-oxygenase